ncbi:MAG: amidohydrolase [Bacteroidota bacterium]
MKILTSFLLLFFAGSLSAQYQDIYSQINLKVDKVESKVIEWRHDLHQNPELSNREFKTAEKIAAHLKSLGLEVRTEIAYTGVVGILRTGKPGPTVGLRADMDALPVTERVDVPYASKVKSQYLGEEVGVMHACGHDTHVAMLMGAAEVLSNMKDQLTGNVVFIFQPAEEGAPPGEGGGAKMMVEQGVLENPKVDAVFGLHINSQTPVNEISFKPGGTLAAADRFHIVVNGKQSHGSQPWGGIDPITIAAQIVQGLNNIVARQTELTKEAAVISVGKIKGGVRNNIIPESCELIGTIRTLDPKMQDIIHERIKRTATNIAESAGATADVEITRGVPVTYNDKDLTGVMLPSVRRAAGGGENVNLIRAKTGAEDFSFYAEKVPALFLFVGGMPADMDPKEAAPHHTPDFFIDDSGMKLGVRTLCYLTVDYMAMD